MHTYNNLYWCANIQACVTHNIVFEIWCAEQLLSFINMVVSPTDNDNTFYNQMYKGTICNLIYPIGDYDGSLVNV